ncbi:hypothetical protein ACFLXB_03570 [Chloroflexota bacterium]
MNKTIICCAIFLLLFSSCTSTNPIPTNNSLKNVTLTNTLLPTSTFTPEPTITKTLIPENEKNALIQTYKIMLFIYMDINMLDQGAKEINSGELSGAESFGYIIGLATLVNAVDKEIPQIKPHDKLNTYWERSLSIHEITKDLISKWFNDEIDSAVVLDEVKPYLAQIENNMSDFEREIENIYGMDADDMKEYRDQAIIDFNSIFSPPTPQPE